MSSKLILGTAQFGLNYGINNIAGKPSKNEVFCILNTAFYAGILSIDTAAAYGDAENLIGEFNANKDNKSFKIITKFHFDQKETIKNKIDQARKKLRVNYIDVLLFHSFKEYKENFQVIESLQEEKANKNLGAVGVSVYHNHEIEELIEDDSIEIIQLPFNLLDNENQRGAILKKAKASGKTIHVRTTFLQGLFFKPINQIPNLLNPLRESLINIHSIAQQSKLAINELALNYPLSKDYIEGVLIGVDSVAHLKENIIASKVLIPNEVWTEVDKIKVTNNELLNPSIWKTTRQ
jgi:aryl-alcohol dehydrogenase-like predicted oxidoreductase